jgi:hypothetical protein
MKTPRLMIVCGVLAVFCMSSCKHDAKDIASFQHQTIQPADETEVSKVTGALCEPNVYVITLESRTQVDGNWEWVWSIRNSNPGNGNNGTGQGISHWGMQFGTCFNGASIVSAAYSADGAVWTGFAPVIQPDNSQTCLETPTLKFDFGTNEAAPSYYKLVVSEDYPVGNTLAYYKSGQRCCTFSFAGLDCSGPVEIVE